MTILLYLWLIIKKMSKHNIYFFMFTGAVPISCLNISFIESLSKLKGHLENVQQFKGSSGDFVLLEGSSSSGICSLLLTSRTFENGAELKVCFILCIFFFFQ